MTIIMSDLFSLLLQAPEVVWLGTDGELFEEQQTLGWRFWRYQCQDGLSTLTDLVLA